MDLKTGFGGMGASLSGFVYWDCLWGYLFIFSNKYL